MPSAANQNAYGTPAWGPGPWGNTNWNESAPQWGGLQWGGLPFWHPAGMSRPVAIAFTVLGFMFWWPVGLAILFYMLGTRRMGCWGNGRKAMKYAMKQQAWQQAAPWGNWKQWGSDRPASSGNHAFDEYRSETLRRLEEEQQEFGSFLERLRFAKDKAEFDQFMAERRGRPPSAPSEEHPAS